MRWLGTALLIATLVPGGALVARAEEVTLTAVNVDLEGVKLWLPSTLVVRRGTRVTIRLINNVASDPGQHGFAIPAYNVAELVPRGEPKQVIFTADREGIFPIICQLHPAHVGGQLVVLPTTGPAPLTPADGRR